MNKTNQIVKREFITSGGLHLREASEGEVSRTIEGYAILFDTPSAAFYQDEEGEMREVIAREAVSQEFLDNSDIKLTMFHDRQLILGRSKNGEGTLSYEIDDKGVKFSCEMPNTCDGDKALELVKRGDLAGCSFAFSTRYYDRSHVDLKIENQNGYCIETYTVRVMTGIYDFTLAADPAYPDTSCEVRELVESLRPAPKKEPVNNEYREQVAEMRKTARQFNV